MAMTSNLALAYEYMNDVPIDKSPVFFLNTDVLEYMRAFGRTDGNLPAKEDRISFNDDVWDFRAYFGGRNDRSLVLRFNDFKDDEKIYVKFFLLYRITQKEKVSSASLKIKEIKKFLKSQEEQNKTLTETILGDINDYIEEGQASRRSDNGKGMVVYCLSLFFLFLIKNYKLPISMDVALLEEMARQKAIPGSVENRIPDIADEYFNDIINAARTVMLDDTAPLNDRITAAGLAVLSQTGLRITDVMFLRPEDLHVKTLRKNNLKINFIHYRESKSSKVSGEYIDCDIFCSNLCKEAFETLTKLRKYVYGYENNPFLIIYPDTNTAPVNNLSVHRSKFNSHVHQFFTKYLPHDCYKPWEGVKPTISKVFHDNNTVYIPESRQYRVHVCTSLYEQGVPLAYIQQYMGHLTDTMIGYYVRPKKNQIQENYKYSEQVIQNIARENMTPIGVSGDELAVNIKKFIEDNKYNVETDIKGIMEALGDKMVIRAKTGGVCIKTSMVPCGKDARTNQALCAYNLCPNIYTFYYMVDITYMDFCALKDTIQMNKDCGRSREAQKELNKLKELCRNRLIPELKELEKELIAKGTNNVVERNPSLINIIENKDEITKEIEIWMKKQ